MLGNESIGADNSLTNIPHHSLSHFHAKSIRASHQITFLSEGKKMAKNERDEKAFFSVKLLHD
jgi:hypothetical protein